MTGKGSVNHNRRKFHAENTNPERSHLNKEYRHENLKDVYRELFDEAVKRYNAKQTRKDRCIDDYYEKIRSGKQEKLFHEVIMQIGNKEDCASGTAEGDLAAKILDEYMNDFQNRNPTLRVFSAHLHMDEATPHLHIDFVPFITGSTRGVDTRVSMKQALAALGFKGGNRGDTEWNHWIQAEKEQLAKVMERHGVEWDQKGTHNEHLSVLDYKKQERTKEVAELDHILSEKEKDLKEIAPLVDAVRKYTEEYDKPPEQLIPEAGKMESAKSYREKKAFPFFRKLLDMLRSLYLAYQRLQEKYYISQQNYWDVYDSRERLLDQCMELKYAVEDLEKVERDFERVKQFLGKDNVKKILLVSKEQEQREKTKKRSERERD